MRRILVLLLTLPVLAWAAISYTLVGHIVAELRKGPFVAIGLLTLWFAISVFVLLALRRLFRGLRGRRLRTY